MQQGADEDELRSIYMDEKIIFEMLPEIIIASMACVILLLDAFVKKNWLNYLISIVAMIMAIVAAYMIYGEDKFNEFGIGCK